MRALHASVARRKHNLHAIIPILEYLIDRALELRRSVQWTTEKSIAGNDHDMRVGRAGNHFRAGQDMAHALQYEILEMRPTGVQNRCSWQLYRHNRPVRSLSQFFARGEIQHDRAVRAVPRHLVSLFRIERAEAAVCIHFGHGPVISVKDRVEALFSVKVNFQKLAPEWHGRAVANVSCLLIPERCDTRFIRRQTQTRVGNGKTIVDHTDDDIFFGKMVCQRLGQFCGSFEWRRARRGHSVRRYGGREPHGFFRLREVAYAFVQKEIYETGVTNCACCLIVRKLLTVGGGHVETCFAGAAFSHSVKSFQQRLPAVGLGRGQQESERRLLIVACAQTVPEKQVQPRAFVQQPFGIGVEPLDRAEFSMRFVPACHRSHSSAARLNISSRKSDVSAVAVEFAIFC